MLAKLSKMELGQLLSSKENLEASIQRQKAALARDTTTLGLLKHELEQRSGVLLTHAEIEQRLGYKVIINERSTDVSCLQDRGAP